MEIKFSEQVGLGDLIEYSFDGEVIMAKFKGVTDTFDFSGFGEGEVRFYDIESDLEIQPVISAKRENGILTVELIKLLDWREGNG